jgi:hypothetical protein
MRQMATTKKVPDVAVKMTEAPASLNFYGVTQTGWNIQVTLRDVDEYSLLDRFGDLVKKLEKWQVSPKAVGKQPEGNGSQNTVPDNPDLPPDDPGFCKIHNCSMPRREKDGQVWFSHKYGDEWCRGE